jgi:hypothetical protein
MSIEQFAPIHLQLPQWVALVVSALGVIGLGAALWLSRGEKFLRGMSMGLLIVYGVNLLFYANILFLRWRPDSLTNADLSTIRSLVNVLAPLPYVAIIVYAAWQLHNHRGKK